MKPLTGQPRVETLVIDYLTPLLLAHGQDVTCGVNIPATWTTTTKPHVLVGHDGTPEIVYPILAKASVRLTAWASSPTVAHNLVALALGLMCAHPGGGGVASVQALTGPLPTLDPDSGAQLASVSVRVNLLMSVLA